MFFSQDGRLVFRYDDEELWIEPWAENAFRVRASKEHAMPQKDWALQPVSGPAARITIEDDHAVIENGKIKAKISRRGKITVYNSNGSVLLEEYARNRLDVVDPKCSALEIKAREFQGIPGGDFHLTVRFESLDKNEKLYGMGQYQQPYLDLKGLDLELAQRNSQVSVPFALSSLGYGFLWNNPAVGRAVFGKNVMSFEAYSTKIMDYWVVAGDSPADIEEAYAQVTGTVPMMPDYGLGFWQCKLRYQTQEELLTVAREYKKRSLPIDLIVIDFFHWPNQGDWRFDKRYFPDPAAMIRELKEMNIELMVSIWPTVDRTSENYEEMLEKGYLIRTDRGFRIVMDCGGNTIHYDATNPDARTFLWEKVKANYYSYGIRSFWLDEAEPEYSAYDFDIYRYSLGTNLSIGNIYPLCYAQTFYEGMSKAGQKNIVNLLRCAWAGSQRYGVLVWSGDVASSWVGFRNQIFAGLNMGIAGIPWWTTDIGGFHGGNPEDEAFRELFVRWFQWGAFCPVMRLHGNREPEKAPLGKEGGGLMPSGAANEVWSYGETVYEICKKYMLIREKMRDYTRALMRDAHTKGKPVIRPLFYEFPKDPKCWEDQTEYMYGWRYLVCPVMNPGQTEMEVYLPQGTKWKPFDGDEQEFEGGRFLKVKCPLESMPVFVKA